MQTTVRRFDELSREELFEIYKLRVAVFVVEQHCPYQEVDDSDKTAYHVYLKEETGEIAAYLRVLPEGPLPGDAVIGRVIAAKRGCHLGAAVLAAGIEAARTRLCAKRVVLAAQVYARPFYEKAGFATISEEFLEDNIPHIWMKRDL